MNPMRPRPAPKKHGTRLDHGPKPASPKQASPKQASPKQASPKQASPKPKPKPAPKIRRVNPEPVPEPMVEVKHRPAPVPTPKSRRRRRAHSMNHVSSRVHNSPMTEESLEKTRNMRTHVQGRKLANLLNRSRKTKNNVRKAENESVASLKNLVDIRQKYQLKRFNMNRFTQKGVTLKDRRKRDRITFSSMNSVVKPSMNSVVKPIEPRSIPRRIAERKEKEKERLGRSTVSRDMFQAFKQNQPELNLPRSLDENVNLKESAPVSLSLNDNMNENTYQQIQGRYAHSRDKPSRKSRS